jgi:hypothetical protein
VTDTVQDRAGGDGASNRSVRLDVTRGQLAAVERHPRAGRARAEPVIDRHGGPRQVPHGVRQLVGEGGTDMAKHAALDGPLRCQGHQAVALEPVRGPAGGVRVHAPTQADGGGGGNGGPEAARIDTCRRGLCGEEDCRQRGEVKVHPLTVALSGLHAKGAPSACGQCRHPAVPVDDNAPTLCDLTAVLSPREGENRGQVAQSRGLGPLGWAHGGEGRLSLWTQPARFTPVDVWGEVTPGSGERRSCGRTDQPKRPEM